MKARHEGQEKPGHILQVSGACGILSYPDLSGIMNSGRHQNNPLLVDHLHHQNTLDHQPQRKDQDHRPEKALLLHP